MEEFRIAQGSDIAMFKVFSVKRDLGSKLTGIRCYNDENEIILSVGWFDGADDVKIVLKPTERVTGIKGWWAPPRKDTEGNDFVPHMGATLYDVQFRIFDTAA